MPLFSNSRLSTYEQCPLKYKYQYIDRIKVETQETVEAFMGSRVHEALEKLYKDLKLQKPNTPEELLTYFNNQWRKHWTADIKIVRKEYTAENYRRSGEKCITDYYNRYAPFHERVLGVETNDHISLDREGQFKWSVRMDRLDDCGRGKYEIHDYKTAGSLPLQADRDEDRQLALYSLWVRENFRDAQNVVLVWHYLAFDREIRSTRTQAELEALRQATLEGVKKAINAKEFPAKESNLCNWCEYQPMCPRWAHLFKAEGLSPEEFKKDDGIRLVDELADLSLQKKETDEKIEAIKPKLIAYAKKFGMEVVFGSGMKAKIAISRNLTFPAKHTKERASLIDLLKQQGLWTEVEDLDVFALKKKVNGGEWRGGILNRLAVYIDEKISESVSLGVTRRRDENG